jgi:hypothetical protein
MTTFWIRLSRVTKPWRSTSHLRPNNNHVSDDIPLRPSRENKKKHSLPAKSWQLFWDRKWVLLVDFMAHGTTINADRYCETLKKLRRAIQNRRRGMLTKGLSSTTRLGPALDLDLYRDPRLPLCLLPLLPLPFLMLNLVSSWLTLGRGDDITCGGGMTSSG